MFWGRPSSVAIWKHLLCTECLETVTLQTICVDGELLPWLAAYGCLWLQGAQTEVWGAAGAPQGSSRVHHELARWLKARVCLISSNMNSLPLLFPGKSGGGGGRLGCVWEGGEGVIWVWTGPVNLGFGWVFCLAEAICITAFFAFQRVSEAWRRRIPRCLILNINLKR